MIYEADHNVIFLSKQTTVIGGRGAFGIHVSELSAMSRMDIRKETGHACTRIQFLEYRKLSAMDRPLKRRLATMQLPVIVSSHSFYKPPPNKDQTAN